MMRAAPPSVKLAACPLERRQAGQPAAEGASQRLPEARARARRRRERRAKVEELPAPEDRSSQRDADALREVRSATHLRLPGANGAARMAFVPDVISAVVDARYPT